MPLIIVGCPLKESPYGSSHDLECGKWGVAGIRGGGEEAVAFRGSSTKSHFPILLSGASVIWCYRNTDKNFNHMVISHLLKK